MESLVLCCVSQDTNTLFPSFSLRSVPEMFLYIPECKGIMAKIGNFLLFIRQ